jgi:hypothetical protein
MEDLAQALRGARSLAVRLWLVVLMEALQQGEGEQRGVVRSDASVPVGERQSQRD